MKVTLFNWANVEKTCGNDSKMLKAFKDFHFQLTKHADWDRPGDIVKTSRTADIISCPGKSYNRVIFNIGGNKYRLICGYKFCKTKVILFIKFAGTHKAYDAIKDICSVDIYS